ncbi:MAG TPA: RagB/SusD family nutrient uptake outer membrane protein, partial [Hanamia sp.]|nr:RagB/SusD family nutrient uptake outer membrane protein [Hanamia sp.]
MRLKLKKINWVSVIVLSLIISGAVSCKKFLDVQPEDKLVSEQMYRDVFDADAAVLGVYGKLMNVAKQYIVLNELRADLMSVTVNADPYLREIGTSAVTEGNPYANPKPFYEVILNCNDVLKNFDIMLKDKKFSQDDYNQRYSDVGAIRSWVYLQLGIQFGNVPYITDPIDNIDDVKDASKFPKVSF